MTQTCLRHRYHHLPAVRRAIDHPRGDRGSCGDHQDSHAPGLAEPSPTTSPGPPRRVHADSLSFHLDSGSGPEPTPPFLPSSPSHTPQWCVMLGLIHGKRASQARRAGSFLHGRLWRWQIAPTMRSLVLSGSVKKGF